MQLSVCMGLLDELQGHYNPPSHAVLAKDVTQVLSALVAYVEGNGKLPDPPDEPGAPESAKLAPVEPGQDVNALRARIAELEAQAADSGHAEAAFSPPQQGAG